MSKSISNVTSQRHKLAQRRQQTYKQLTGENGNYKDFFQNKDVIRGNIVVYNVSLQLSYQSAENSLVMDTAVTYKVYAFRNAMSDDRIYQETQNALANMSKGKNKFNPVTTEKVITNERYNNLRVVPIRGMEISDEVVKEDIIEKLKMTKTGFYVEENDKKISLKNKNGYSVDMNLDLANYFNR